MSSSAHLEPVSAPQFAEELDWLLHTVAVTALDQTGWIRVTGSDCVRWLNGMVTNSIQDLKAGEGNYSFALNAQGRIQADMSTFAEPNGLMLETARDRVEAMIAMFDRYIIMDDVELADLSDVRFGMGATGPQAAALLTSLGLPIPEANQRLSAVFQGVAVEVIAAYSPLVPRFEIWSPAGNLLAPLSSAAAALEGGMARLNVLESLRILEGIPKYGVDIREKELPQETAQTRALHFAKGCYLGQEIVERIRSRGNVHRTFAGFRLEGTLPVLGTSLVAEGKPIGELTSVETVYVNGQTTFLALGFVRREAIERGFEIEYEGGRAFPESLPMRWSAARSQDEPSNASQASESIERE